MAEKQESSFTFNPADALSLRGALRHMEKHQMMLLETCVPARVIEYNRTTHKAKVAPLVKFSYPNGDKIESSERAAITVTVWRMQCGGFMIDLPLYPGDTGWLFASDKDSYAAKSKNSSGVTKDGSEYKTDNEGAQIGCKRCHRFQDGFFMPDRWGEVAIGDDETDDIIVQSMNGLGKLSIKPNGALNIVAAHGVNIEGNLNVIGDTDIVGTMKVEPTGDSGIKRFEGTEAEETFHSNGNVTMSGELIDVKNTLKVEGTLDAEVEIPADATFNSVTITGAEGLTTTRVGVNGNIACAGISANNISISSSLYADAITANMITMLKHSGRQTNIWFLDYGGNKRCITSNGTGYLTGGN